MSMHQPPVHVHRLPHRIKPDPSRMITRFFAANDEANRERIERVLTLPAAEAQEILANLKGRYGVRHPDIDEIWMESFQRVATLVPPGAAIDDKRRILIGSYFTMEYAVEAAALFNPSIVPTINQMGLAPGCTRFLMSLRATGEGHLSSIVFRVGVIDADNRITMEDTAPSLRALKPIPDAEFDTNFLRNSLADLGALGPFECIVLDKLGETFSISELRQMLAELRFAAPSTAGFEQTHRNMLTFARSNYRMPIPWDVHPSEVVIFPISENESRGIEDVRLVRFTEDDGAGTIYGTYTAYNGISGFPSLFISNDLKTIASHTMAGKFVKNKGMALFPRRINGNYVMSGRLDGVNRYILESDNVLVWNRGRPSETPKYWWEFSIIGNCGSPVETPEGWLMLTHGVGPMRQYAIAATLLDLDNPAQVIGRSAEPIIVPAEDERVGYVPNVVYTCGAMLHNDSLIIPYAMGDVTTTFACLRVDELIASLKSA
jgi:predicted GH43/DUF377 family glycosyl hydrolase